MKLSAGTVGTLVFTALATTAFVWMAKRPPVDVTAMQFGMPSMKTEEAKKAEGTAPQVVEDKKEAAAMAPEATTTNETEKKEEPASPAASEQPAEPIKTEGTTEPASETIAPAEPTDALKKDDNTGTDNVSSNANPETPKVDTPAVESAPVAEPEAGKDAN